MGTLASLSDASAWLAPLGALAATLLFATIMLLRDLHRLSQHAVSLEAQVERLQDRTWQLAESEEQHRTLVEAQLDIIVLRDLQGYITFANDAYAKLAGRPREDLLGSPKALKVIESGPVHIRLDGARLVDEAIETAAGVRWIAWIEAPARGPGGAPAVLRLGREVTDRVVSERALEEARAKAEAASEAKSLANAGDNVWIAGDSAMRYHAERKGVAWAKADLSDVPVGGVVTISSLLAIGYRQHPLFTKQARLTRRMHLESWNPMRTQETQVSFYGANVMTLPWMMDLRPHGSGPNGERTYDSVLFYRRMK